MDKTEVVFNGQLFVKVLPDDNSEEIFQARNELPELRKAFFLKKQKIEKKEFISQKDQDELLEDIMNIKSKLKSAYTIDRINMDGMNKFWSLSINESGYSLISNRLYENDEMILNTYKSLKELSEKYRSLSDIFHNEEFIGRRINPKNIISNTDRPVYGLFELDNIVMFCTVDEKKQMERIFLSSKQYPVSLSYIGDSKPELNNPGKILRLIYKQGRLR